MENPASPGILIIDDDHSMRQVIALGLERRGYRVRSAESGRAGLRAFDAERPALVITDILMPDIEGIETIMALKAKGGPAAKIIAMSGGGRLVGHDFLKWATHLGADRTLAKPFRLSALLAMVVELIGEADAPKAPGGWRSTAQAQDAGAGSDEGLYGKPHADA